MLHINTYMKNNKKLYTNYFAMHNIAVGCSVKKKKKHKLTNFCY